MKYIVANINGKQYRLEEKEEFFVDKLTKKLEPKVLLYVDGEKIKIGKPEVSGVKLSIKTIEEVVKGKKIYVSKYKAKSRYRKKTGFRPQYTKLLLEKISI